MRSNWKQVTTNVASNVPALREGCVHTDPLILLIDDDRELCELIKEAVTQRGLQVHVAHDGRSGLSLVLSDKYDLILLDVMLPKIDGLDVLREVRQKSNVPIIMLSAKGEPTDRVAGLEGGADDYLPKPFGPDELVARIRAVWRRTQRPSPSQEGAICINGVRLEPGQRQVWFDNQLVDTTAVEYDVCEILIRSAGRIVSREELSVSLYQRPAFPQERSLDVHVSHLRKKLGIGGTIHPHRAWEGLFVLRQRGCQMNLRSIVPKTVIWLIGAVAVVLIGLMMTAHFAASRVSGLPEFFAATQQLQMETACRIYEREGREPLRIYLERLDELFRGRHYLVDRDDRDIVSDRDLSEFSKQAQSFESHPDVFREDVIFERRSGDDKYRFLVEIIPPISRWNILPYFGWILVMIVAMGYGFAVNIVRPVKRLQNAVVQLGSGKLDVRVDFNRRDEFGELGRAFDHMAQRIESLLTAERLLLQDISHELRSPLTRLRFALDLARNNEAVEPAFQRVDRGSISFGGTCRPTPPTNPCRRRHHRPDHDRHFTPRSHFRIN